MRMKAISPVVATLILIIVAVVAGVATYGFVTGFIAQTTSQGKSPSSIVIDAASLDVSDKKVTVEVRNVGQQDATVVAIYVLNADDQSLVDSFILSSPVTISAGDSQEISDTASSVNFSANNWYIVKVVTQDGSSATLKVKAQA